DIKPYAFKTMDGGKTWTRIDNGIPEGSFVHAVREDPVKRGLLYAATETGVFVSFDDGAHWQSLQINLPRSPVHDLVVKGDDLVIATHGRSFWILDDITPLRQVAAATTASNAFLYAPQTATLVLAADPRVKEPLTGLQQKFALRMQTYHDLDTLHRAVNDIRAFKSEVAGLHKKPNANAGLLSEGDKAAAHASAIEARLM